MITFPASLPVEKLNQKHPEYAANLKAWSEIELLYRDGSALRAHAQTFLTRKPREVQEVYQARLQRFTSQPILGAALGWYQAAMFGNNPSVGLMRDGNTVEDDKDYADFLEDCNAADVDFVDFARDVFLSMLLYKSSWVLVDRAMPDESKPAPQSLADQKATGGLDVYLVRYDPSQVINWECDQYGNLEWVLIATTNEEREFPGKVVVKDRWYYFDRTQCALYEATREGNEAAKDAALVTGYPRPHVLSQSNEVPVTRIEVPDGLWLGNRAYLSARTHLDLVNALDWGIFNGCLPTLWVKGEYNDSVTRSEIGHVGLAVDGEIGFLEPAGNTFKLAMENKDGWREELFRQVYLQAQGRSTKATPAAQSGYSKEMDMMPSQDVLNGLADFLRSGLEEVLESVATARGDKGVEFVISGLEFEGDDSHETDRDEVFLSLNLGETVEKTVKKRIAARALKDATPELLAQANTEIDALPTELELAAQTVQQAVGQAFSKNQGKDLRAV